VDFFHEPALCLEAGGDAATAERHAALSAMPCRSSGAEEEVGEDDGRYTHAAPPRLSAVLR
jgi:hypothetical protein